MTSPRPTIRPHEGTIGMPDGYYRVAKVIDGMTLDVWDEKGLVRVWVFGVKPPGEGTPIHELGRRIIRKKLQAGDPVYLKVHDFNFKWRRAIAELTTDRSESIGNLLIRAGFEPFKKTD